MIVVDSADAMRHMRHCQLIGALKIETRTGMKMSRGGSVLAVAQREFGVTSRPKKGALDELPRMYKETYGWEFGFKREEPSRG